MAFTRTILGGTSTDDTTFVADVYVKGPHPWADVMAYGAKGDGTTDDLTAINSAIASLPNSGGIVFFPRGDYAVSGQVVIGNGTSASLSTKRNITLLGAGTGSDAAEMGSSTYGSRIKRITNSGDAVLKVAGPISSVRIEGLTLDANGLAANGLNAVHILQFTCRHVQVIGHTGYGILVGVYDPAPPGMAVGFSDGVWENVKVRLGSGTAYGGIKIGETTTNGEVFDVNRQTFLQCDFSRYGTSTVSIDIGFADNMTFINCFTPGLYGTNNGIGVKFNAPPAVPAFPKEITFINCPLCGTVESAGGWSPVNAGAIFLPYSVEDGQTIPDLPKSFGLGYDGQFFGEITGVSQMLHGSTGTSTLATSGTEFISCFAPLLNSTEANVQATVEKSAVIAFSVDLDTVPGGTATRTFTLRKNGADTSAVVSYTAAQSGVQSYTTVTTLAAGDKIAVSATSSNTPTASRARVRLKTELRP